MRGVGNWAVGVRKPVPGAPRGRSSARARSRSSPSRWTPPCAATAPCACRSSAAWWRWAARWRSASRRSRSPPTRSSSKNPPPVRPSDGEDGAEPHSNGAEALSNGAEAHSNGAEAHGDGAEPRSATAREAHGNGVAAATQRRGSRTPTATSRRATAPAAEKEPEEIPRAVWLGTIVVALVLAIVLFFIVPVGPHQPDQGPARLAGAVLARRGDHPHGAVPRLHVPALAGQRPAARVRVPRGRAQDDLLLRGRTAADRSQRPALLPAAPALRHELPAGGDDRGDLRLRADRPARLVLAGADPHHRRPADRRHLLRADQVRRAQPQPALGAGP